MKPEYIWFETACIDWGGGPKFMFGLSSFLAQHKIRCDFVIFSFNSDLLELVNGANVTSMQQVKDLDEHSKINLRGSMLVRFIKRLMWLRKQIKRNPDAKIITTGQWESSIWVFLATIGLNRYFTTFVYGSLFTFSIENDITKFSIQMREAYKQIIPKYINYGHIDEAAVKVIPIKSRLKSELLFYLRKKSLKKANKVFSLTNSVSQEVIKMYGVKCDPLPLVFEHDVELRNDHSEKREQYFVVIGRLIPSKRNDVVLRKFFKFAETNKLVKLKIVGVGPELARLKEIVRSYKLEHRVDFLGFVSEESKSLLVQNATASFCLDIADFNLTVLESLIAKTPVIVSDIFDFPMEIFTSGALITETMFEKWCRETDLNNIDIDWSKIEPIINHHYGMKTNIYKLIGRL